jgi:hypothetical protein
MSRGLGQIERQIAAIDKQKARSLLGIPPPRPGVPILLAYCRGLLPAAGLVA